MFGLSGRFTLLRASEFGWRHLTTTQAIPAPSSGSNRDYTNTANELKMLETLKFLLWRLLFLAKAEN